MRTGSMSATARRAAVPLVGAAVLAGLYAHTTWLNDVTASATAS